LTQSDYTPKPIRIPQGRTARLGRMGTMAAGVAGSALLEGAKTLAKGQRPRLQDMVMTPSTMRRVADDLARMRGAAMKVGQLLSMESSDLMPPEVMDVLARLRADADFMPPKQLKTTLSAEWGDDWLRWFRQFDTRPIAAASIGQVHRAHTRDGHDLAIKVQYPGVAESIDSDIANVGALIRATGALPKSFDLRQYLDAARTQLHEETDYAVEANSLMRFHSLLSDTPDFLVPTHVPQWSTKRILAMEFVGSRPLDTVTEEAQEVRDRVATALIDLTLRELFEFRLMQTDPNLANYRITPEGERIVLLDFGATRELSSELVADYARIMTAGLAGDRGALQDAAFALGLLSRDMESDVLEAVLDMIARVFEMVTAQDTFDFGASDLMDEMQARGMALSNRKVAPPEPPVEVLFLQRKFAGMFLMAARLKARVPVVEIIEKYLAIHRA